MKRDPGEVARRIVRLLPGVGPAVVRAARALGFLADRAAQRAPEARVWTVGDPIEQARALAREEEETLLGAAIGITLALHEDAFLAEEPRVLTLRGSRSSGSNWWHARLAPSSLPPRRTGGPVPPDVFRMSEADVPPPPAAGGAGPEREE